MTLLELLLAVLLLGTSGVAALRLASHAVTATVQAHESEARLLAASRFLDAAALWPREGLDQRLGRRPQGDWTLQIEHPAGDVYFMTLLETASGRTLLETAVYRPIHEAEL